MIHLFNHGLMVHHHVIIEFANCRSTDYTTQHYTMSGFDSSDEESGDFDLTQFPIWW